MQPGHATELWIHTWHLEGVIMCNIYDRAAAVDTWHDMVTFRFLKTMFDDLMTLILWPTGSCGSQHLTMQDCKV